MDDPRWPWPCLLLTVRDVGTSEDEPVAVRLRRALKTMLRRDHLRIVAIKPIQESPDASETSPS